MKMADLLPLKGYSYSLSHVHAENTKLENVWGKIRKKSWNFKPFALKKPKIVYSFGLSECKRVKVEDEYS